jgi:hypothetical protein
VGAFVVLAHRSGMTVILVDEAIGLAAALSIAGLIILVKVVVIASIDRQLVDEWIESTNQEEDIAGGFRRDTCMSRAPKTQFSQNRRCAFTFTLPPNVDNQSKVSRFTFLLLCLLVLFNCILLSRRNDRSTASPGDQNATWRDYTEGGGLKGRMSLRLREPLTHHIIQALC